ncbi:hypothetical protein GCM10011317_02030 [Niveispirillum cyanobacteriorum]|nr:hypothetical protein GCM10011317_02030 [Niveispirillum cyanobacteriorum]
MGLAPGAPGAVAARAVPHINRAARVPVTVRAVLRKVLVMSLPNPTDYGPGFVAVALEENRSGINAGFTG